MSASLTAETFEAELEELHEKHAREWRERHEQDVPPVLYHYTNAEGLIGILGRKQIWASNVCFLNDARELIHGRMLVEKVIEEGLETHPTGKAHDFLADCRERVRSGRLELDVYAACFCTDGDLLSQWRGYGSMGDGYSLGLCSESLRRGRFRPSSYKFALRRVIYDPECQTKMIQESVCNVCRLIERAAATLPAAELDHLLSEAGCKLDEQLKEFLYCFKDPAFAEEREWRIVHTCPAAIYNKDLQFRASRGRIVPYVLLPLDGLTDPDNSLIPLVNLRFGSVLSPITTSKSLEHLLKFHKYEKVTSRPSGVPLI
ncbi:MAG TPA: DUF2971 domain-containing protein [Pyrinomonadaceae bacterium]|jgi:hypothetical protein